MNQKIKAGVVGAGMIGMSMCVLLTGNGIPTILYVRSKAQERWEQYREILSGLVEDGHLTEEERERCESYFCIVSSYEELEEINIAFECTAENLEIKKEVFGNLRKYCPNLLAAASTTSAISSTALSEVCEMPDKVIVAHPFYPPHLIPCVEIVPNEKTSPQTLEIVTELLKATGREVVVLKKDAPGFIANRLQYAMLREAVHIVEEGIAAPCDVDRVLMYSFAPRYTSIGIFEHFDNCGLNLAGDIAQYLYPELCNEKAVQNYITQRCLQGKIGVKSGEGTYLWDEKKLEELRERIKEPYEKYFSWNVPDKPYEA